MWTVFSPTNNNGQITQMIDHIAGETVSYTYDSLRRLATAGSAQWGLSFTYDGFGNRTAQTATLGSPPSATFNFSATTNRITTAGFAYDANGNMTTMPAVGTVSYDVENRMTGAAGDTYGYSQAGQRLLTSGNSGVKLHFFGIDGRELGAYQPGLHYDPIFGTYSWVFTTTNRSVYFNGKLIQSDGGGVTNLAVVTDRLGSVRANSTGGTFRYYPYGESTRQRRRKK